MARGHGAARRWALVGTLVALLLALPSLIGLWPAADADRSAAELRTAVLASAGLAFSGYAESAGGLQLPVTDQLSSVADLFSDRTTMRVWWRGPADNRVDVVDAAGERDVHRDTAGTWTWNYEGNRATRTDASPLSLPAPTDLLPPTLARRLLSEADPAELSRLGAHRVAGRDALGLRLVPAQDASSVARVDVWVDAGTGLPLQVQLFGEGAPNPALDTRFLDLVLRRPAAEVTAFTPPAGAVVLRGDDLGVLEDATRRLARVPLPRTLAGLPRRTIDGAPPAIGIYGRGVTLLAVVPVPDRLAGELQRAAAASPTAVRDQLGTRLAAGPLGIMLVGTPGRTTYLLTGTVTLDALARAAGELPDLDGRP
jgi:outer membrane lipoprotein-sorting protein